MSTQTLLPYTLLKTYHARIRAMLDDPECGGDLLSLGISLLDYAILRTTTDKSWQHYAKAAWGESHRYQVRDVLRKDIRRYDAFKDAEGGQWARICGAPMIRRQGPCGQTGSLRTMLTDSESGRRQWLAACSRHREWFEARVHENRMAVTSDDVVVRPPANTGGVLARHIPEIDWPTTWVKLDPNWTPPPEETPLEVPLKPRLRLVLGGA